MKPSRGACSFSDGLTPLISTPGRLGGVWPAARDGIASRTARAARPHGLPFIGILLWGCISSLPRAKVASRYRCVKWKRFRAASVTQPRVNRTACCGALQRFPSFERHLRTRMPTVVLVGRPEAPQFRRGAYRGSGSDRVLTSDRESVGVKPANCPSGRELDRVS